MPLINRVFRKIQPYFINKRDVMIISYPKVGNTFTRLVLANVILNVKEGRSADYFLLERILPEIGKKNFFNSWKYEGFPKFIKTHDLYRKEFQNSKGILYIVRDPRDTLISYYHFTKAHLGYRDAPSEFDVFIRDAKYGLHALNLHLENYYERAMMIFKYEDLMKASKPLFKEFFEKLNLEISDKVLETAIHNSSPQSMKKVSSEKGTPYEKKFDKDFNFIRNASLNQWKDVYNKEQLNYIRNNASCYFHSLGYEF